MLEIDFCWLDLKSVHDISGIHPKALLLKSVTYLFVAHVRNYRKFCEEFNLYWAASPNL